MRSNSILSRSSSALLFIACVITSVKAGICREQSAFLALAAVHRRGHGDIRPSRNIEGRRCLPDPTKLHFKGGNNDNSNNGDEEATCCNNDKSASIPTVKMGLAASCGHFLALLVFATTPLPATASAGDIARGATLFANNCASCHRGGENIMKPAKTLQETDLVKNLGSADQATIQKFFSNSFNHKLLNFPSVPGGKLAEADVVDVTSYVSDQALGSKW